MKQIFLIKIGEISLKGGNRRLFEKKLVTNIKKQLGDIRVRITGRAGRFFLESEDIENPDIAGKIENTLSKVFGIVAYSKASAVEKNMKIIEKTALETAEKILSENSFRSFKVESRRADKSFPLSSYDISCRIGEIILEKYKGLRVDVKNPDFRIRIEIRESAYIYGPETRGPGGLPAGIAGKTILLLSGGIDSPVAGYMMGKRGAYIEAIYFHTYPYTSDQALEKVKTLAKRLSDYLPSIKLHVVPFTDIQLYIKGKCRKDEVTLLSRGAMMIIANSLAVKTGANSITTGESLSQVASQTAESMRFTGSKTSLPVFRPLIGLDKEEIIKIARNIDTFDTSTLPYNDCCTVFAPEHPLVKPDFDSINESFNMLNIEEMIIETFSKIESHYIKRND